MVWLISLLLGILWIFFGVGAVKGLIMGDLPISGSGRRGKGSAITARIVGAICALLFLGGCVLIVWILLERQKNLGG